MIDTVLFDLDGTLLDTLFDLDASVNYALEQCDLPPVTINDTSLTAGYGSIVLIEKTTKGVYPTDSPEFKRVHDLFLEHYHEHSNDYTAVYRGIPELLDGLKEREIKMGIVSNKVQEDTEALRALWFDDLIPVAVGRREGIAIKPAPDMVLTALEELESRPENTLLLGDSEPDIQTGINAGCATVGCTWGFRDRDFLSSHGATVFAESPHHLLVSPSRSYQTICLLRKYFC